MLLDSAFAGEAPTPHGPLLLYIPALMPTFYDRFVECAERWPQNVAIEVQRPNGVESHTYPELLKNSGASLMICDTKHLEIAIEAVAGSEVSVVVTESPAVKTGRPATHVPPSSGSLVDFDSIFSQYQGTFKPVPRRPDDLASLLYTSGTTADPKGVMLTDGNLLGAAEAVFAWAHIGPEDAVLGVLPLFHVLSQMANLLLPLVAGARVVYLSTLNTTELLKALRERNITAFAVVPQFFYLIHDRILKEVQQRDV